MSWRERDYSRVSFPGERLRAAGIVLPPRGSLVLIGLHVVSFLTLRMTQADEGRALALAGGEGTAWGVLLHPLATESVLTLLFVVFVIWALGGRLESRDGPGRMLVMYVGGNALAGAVFFFAARWQRELATLALDFPAGAFAAWCLTAWRSMRSDFISVFGRMTTVAKLVAIMAGVSIALRLLGNGLGAVVWLAAIVAGSTAASMTEGGWALRRRSPPSRPANRRPAQRSRQAEPAPPEPDIDEILARISREGMDALSQEDLDRLEAARRAKLR